MARVPALELDNQICFRIYRLHRLINARYRPLLDALGLTYPQYLVMLVLWEQDGISLGALGKRLDLDSGTLSPLLKRLEVLDYISRSRDSADERSLLIQLTRTGRELRARAEGIPEAVASCFDGDIQDFASLTRILDTAISSLDGCT